ncbi:ATP synthase subunit s, mitochondrial [Anthophora retusa]
MSLYTSIRLAPNVFKSANYQTKSLFYWLTIIFNRVDLDSIKELGPDLACAQWLLRNGAAVRWTNSKELTRDYNKLPSNNNHYIEAVDATDSGICHVGFPHFKGCNYIKDVKLINCVYIDNAAMGALSILKDTLTHLEVVDCKSVENEGLRKLKVLKNLETLKLKGLPAVADDSICKELGEALPKCSGKDCRLYVQKLNLVKEHKLEENVSFQECNIDDYSEQSNLEVVENKWAKYLDTPEEVQFDNFATSNSQGTSYHKSNNSVYLDDDNEMCECSDNDHTDMNNDFSYENTISQYSDYDNEKEDSNIKTEDKLDNISFNNDNSKSSDCHKCTENIFDDNEDFDLTINF